MKHFFKVVCCLVLNLSLCLVSQAQVSVFSSSGAYPSWPGANVYMSGGTTLNNQLLAIWNFDEAVGTGAGNGGDRTDCVFAITLKDVTGKINASTAKVGAFAAQGQQQGVGDGLSVTNATFNLAAGHAFTFSSWFKEASGNADPAYAFACKGTNVTGCDFCIHNDLQNNLWFDWHGAGGNNQTTKIMLVGTALDGAWHHIAVGFDDVLQYVWYQIDNGLRITKSETTIAWSGAPFNVFWSGTSGAPYNGQADALGLWSRSLSLEEVGQLYNNGNGQQCPFALVGATSGSLIANSQVNDWYRRCTTAGGIPTSASVTIVTTFWQGCISDGIDAKILMANLFVPDSLPVALTPLVVGAGANSWTVSGIVGGDLGANGITGNAGSSKFINTGMSPGPLSRNAGLAVYDYTVTATGIAMGCRNAGPLQILDLIPKFLDNNSDSENGAPANIITVASPGNGFYLGSRVSNTDHRLFFANSSTAWAQIGATDSTAFAASQPNFSLYVLGANSANVVLVPCSDTVSFAAYLNDFTSADGLKLYNRVQQARTDLGGGFR